MKGLAKGQGQLATVAIALTIALMLSQIPDFTVRYVLGNTFSAMEMNQRRYESVAHSYKFISDGENNKMNYSEIDWKISSVSGEDFCRMEIYDPENYRVWFAGVGYGDTFDDDFDCIDDDITVADGSSMVYPHLNFYETKEEDMNRVISGVN